MNREMSRGAVMSTGVSSVSITKLLLVLTTALGNALAAPLVDTVRGSVFPASNTALLNPVHALHDHPREEGPKSTSQLVFDCISIAVRSSLEMRPYRGDMESLTTDPMPPANRFLLPPRHRVLFLGVVSALA